MAFPRLSEQERISLLMMRGWGDRQRSYAQVRELFNQIFRNEAGQTSVSKSTIIRAIQRFEDTGGVKNRRNPGRPTSVTNEEKQMEIAEAFVENPHLSIRRAAEQHDISKMSVHKILKLIKFHPYKVHLVHELNEDDPDHRIEFCELMMNRIDRDPNFLYNIVFSDECIFTLKGEVNRHNCRYWSDTNPLWVTDDHTQYPQKVNVWAGILNDTLVGPFFIDGNLTATKYEDMLQNQIVPKIREIASDNFDDTWYQQDGAAPHYGRDVRAFLDAQFPHRWIGRRGEIEWPARSPDLTPLDYFLWGYLKSKVYQIKPRDLDELRNRILQETALVDRNMIRRAVSNFYERIAHCQAVDGTQFEHLL